MFMYNELHLTDHSTFMCPAGVEDFYCMSKN